MKNMSGVNRSANDATGVLVRSAFAQRESTKAVNDNAKALRNNGFAYRNAGQQVGDFGLQVATGQNVALAFSQQIGQLGYALGTLESGPLKKVGAFMVGPWGIAFTIGLAVLAPFVAKLFEAETAAKRVELATVSLGDAQSSLGGIFDLQTGKIEHQTEALLLNARAMALNLRAESLTKDQKARETLRTAGDPSFSQQAGNLLTRYIGYDAPSGNDAVRRLAAQTRSANAITDDKARTEALDRLLRQSDVTDFKGSGVDKAKFQQAILDSAASRANTAIADLIDKSLDDKKLADGLKREGTKKKPKDGSKAAAALAEFGRDAIDKIAQIGDAFTDTPAQVAKVNQAVRVLDDLIDDLSRKKPPGFEKTIAEAQRLKLVVVDALNKPYQDFIEQQQNALDVQKLITAGRLDEAEALKIVQGLQKTMAPLTQAQRDGVLETVKALKEQQRQTDILREKNEKYLTSIGSIKTALEDASQAFVRGDLGSFLQTPGKILDAFQTLQGKKLFEGIFGDTFRELEEQQNGTGAVRAASEKMAKSVDGVAESSQKVGHEFDNLATAAGRAATALVGAANGHTFGGAPVGNDLFSLLSQGNGVPSQEDIVVTAARSRVTGSKADESPAQFYNRTFGKLGEKIDNSLGNHLGDGFFQKLGGSLGGVLQTASIGSQLGRLIGGAQGGSIGGGIGGILQLVANQTGIGGGLANFASAAGPYAPLVALAMQAGSGIFDLVAGAGKKKNVASSGIFGLLGSALGGLFATTKRGGSLVTSATGGTSIFGNDSATQASAGSLGGQVQQGVKSIADALGGALGNFAVSIGYFGDKIRVDTSGYTGSLDSKHAPALHGFATEAEAVSFAILDAIKDGGVQGLSAAVQKALASSPDIDAALKEALKVREVETLIGGIGGQLKATFDAFDKEAAERVRIANQYGLDIVAIEKINGEERAKLIADTLAQSVGSLQSLLTDLTSGDLFEGSAADKRKAILAQIGLTQADALAGKAGAADTLADLYRQLIGNSRDAYGTAGPEYAADRATAQSGAEAIIKAETDRINAAAGIAAQTAAAVQLTADLTNETNQLLSVMNTKIAGLPADIAAAVADYIAKLAALPGQVDNLIPVVRYTDLGNG